MHTVLEHSFWVRDVASPEFGADTDFRADWPTSGRFAHVQLEGYRDRVCLGAGMKRTLGAVTLTILPVVVAAQAFDKPSQISTTATRVVTAADPVQAAEDAMTRFALSTANSELSAFSAGLLGDRLKYLSLSLGYDQGEVQLEGMSVYGLHETKNWFIFNQTSIVNYDGRTTLNFGIGARHINDSDTVILGLNAFHDYEFGSEHRRASIGGEVLTSLFQLRANYYKALTDERLYEGTYEEALDGHDFKFTYELPYFYDSDVFFKASHWYDGNGYRTSTDEFGLTAEVVPNMIVKLAGSRTDGGSTDALASVTYRLVFGARPDTRVKRDGVWRFALEPVRHMLYQPVERENRIVKKTVKFGVTVSGI